MQLRYTVVYLLRCVMIKLYYLFDDDDEIFEISLVCKKKIIYILL